MIAGRDGEIGRRSGLKIRRGQKPCGGSIPPPGTSKLFAPGCVSDGVGFYHPARWRVRLESGNGVSRLISRMFSPSSQFPQRPRSRWGCLGCLPRLILILAFGAALVLLITAVFAPWGFFLGGKFHILPYWRGWGTAQAKSGKYLVYVQFQPRRSGSRIYPGPSVGGVAYLCSPRGEEFRMNLGGGMRRGIGLDTNGEKISLYAYYYPAFFGNLRSERRPGIEIRGQWQDPNIVGDDHGSIFRAFLPDGTVDRGQGPRRNVPYPGDITPITLTPGSYSDFEAACKAH